MKNVINDEAFKTVTAAHKRFWESLCAVLPRFQASDASDLWQETFLKNLATYEDIVKRTLKAESAWVEQWVKQMASQQGMPEPVLGWVNQLEEIMQHWLQTQSKLWEECFTMLRSGGDRAQKLASPKVTIKPEAVEPARQLEPAKDTAEPQAGPEPSKAAGKRQEKDDLKTISGLGPAIEKKLYDYGIVSYRQLAQLGDAEVERIERSLKLSGRIRRFNWIEQAREQHFQKYNERL